MKCPDCKLVEMLVEKVVNDTVIHKCKKCGKEIEEPLPKEDFNVKSE